MYACVKPRLNQSQRLTHLERSFVVFFFSKHNAFIKKKKKHYYLRVQYNFEANFLFILFKNSEKTICGKRSIHWHMHIYICAYKSYNIFCCCMCLHVNKQMSTTTTTTEIAEVKRRQRNAYSPHKHISLQPSLNYCPLPVDLQMQIHTYKYIAHIVTHIHMLLFICQRVLVGAST